MSQRHEHLLAAPIALAHVILDDRVAAGEATFIAKPVEYPLGRMALRHPFGNSQANPQIKFHGVDPLPLPHSLQKGNRWPDFTPPAAALCRRYRGRLLHRRSHMKFSPMRHTLSDISAHETKLA
ncbi:hypothetical protein J2X08_004465 [Rhizobium rosettiformans]|nr:hypothetical protein [Rhizobium rosettiformans]MDR7066939.1 hypothetical protein [Rhizobium rosettiformans]